MKRRSIVPIGNSLRQPNRKNKNEPIKILHIKNDMKARLRKTGEVVELRQYYCDGTAKGVNGEYYHQGDISELFEDIDYKRLEYEFNQLGRTEKCEFISQHIELASSKAIAKYVKEYLFDVLKDIGHDGYIATYLQNKGYKVEINIK
jgi:hypothetical protein